MEIITDIESHGTDLAYVKGPFDEGLSALESRGYRLITLEDHARLRLQGGEKDFVSRNGSWGREGSLYVPGKRGKFITKVSAVLVDPSKATRAHKQKKEYVISDELVQRALESSVQVYRDISDIPVEAFGEEKITVFCFGESAKDYGLFLKEEGIKKMPLVFGIDCYHPEREKPYANQMWLSWLRCASQLMSLGWRLYGNSGSFGIKELEKEAA